MLKIAPSILAADLAYLGQDVEDVKAAGADLIHFDVMDGVFVPNISLGLPILQSLRRVTDMFIDAHLMVETPLRYAGRFCEAGADLVNIHVEADSTDILLMTIEHIKSMGKKAGVTLKPSTPAGAVLPFLSMVDMVLVMTVEPGFGGQSFMAGQLTKISAIRELINKYNPSCDLEVDGGITDKTAGLVKAAGANVLVTGSFVFGQADRHAAIRALREA